MTPQSPEELVAEIERLEGVLDIYNRDVQAGFGPELTKRLEASIQNRFKQPPEGSVNLSKVSNNARAEADNLFH